MYPIFIPSKGRAKTCRTPQLLAAAYLPCTLVVEPQEADAYAMYHPGCAMLVLPESERGLAFARQWILGYCRQNGVLWHWQIDDDISGYYEKRAKRLVKCPASRWYRYANRLAEQFQNVAQISLMFKNYAWAAKEPYSLNRNAACTILTRTDTGLSYAPIRSAEDIHFTLQHLTRGWVTLQLAKYSFATATIGSGGGGSGEAYAAREDELAALWVHRQFPGVTRMQERKRDGRLMVRGKWAAFPQRPAEYERVLDEIR